MKRASLAVLILLAAAMAALPVCADTLYSDGPANNNGGGDGINQGYALADSFMLAQNSTVTGADFNVWLEVGDTLTSVEYLISTEPFGGTTEGTATVDPTGSFIETNSYPYDVYTESFSISSLDLSAGTYYLELENAVTADAGPAFWDVNNGPSTAYLYSGGSVNPLYDGQSDAETFDITGSVDASPVPEPSSLMLLGTGLLGLAGLMRRKLRA